MAEHPARIQSTLDWCKLLAGASIVFIIFQWLALRLGSDRGQAGLLIAAAIFAALIAIEHWLFSVPPAHALRVLGFGRPALRGIVAAAGVSVLLVATIIPFALARGYQLAMLPGWALLLPGLFGQAGIAEEALFRGYLFGHLLQGRQFWRAALLAMAPFTAAHLFLFATFAWPIAAASLLLAAAMAFPLARLYVLGGRTIWPPALLHFVAQGTLKVVIIPEDAAQILPLVWIAACAIAPYVVFLMRPRAEGSAG